MAYAAMDTNGPLTNQTCSVLCPVAKSLGAFFVDKIAAHGVVTLDTRDCINILNLIHKLEASSK